MGTEKQRLRILDRLKQTFIDSGARGLALDRAKLISEICVNYGVTRRKAAEYLKVLLDADFIIETSSGLELSEKYLPNEKEVNGGSAPENPLANSGWIPEGTKL